MDKRLSGRSAIVTGSSHGIGRAVALAMAAEGVMVVVNGSGTGPAGVGSDLESLNSVAMEIKSSGGTAVASCGSVADFTYAETLIKTCLDAFGRLDILVNCAGIPEVGSIIDVPLEIWQQVIGVHLNGTFNCCRHACPLMAEQRSGRILSIGSHAFLGVYGGTAYAAAKGGIVSLTKAMARDMGDYGVTCNVLLPGALTRLSTGEAYEQRIRSLHARGLLTERNTAEALNPPPPEYVPPLVLYLASDEAASITGQVFAVSGGYVGLLTDPEEVLLVFRDHKKAPPWTAEELAALLPHKLAVLNSPPTPEENAR